MFSLFLCFLSVFGHFQDLFETINAEVNYENHPYTRNTKLKDSLTVDTIRFKLDFTWQTLFFLFALLLSSKARQTGLFFFFLSELLNDVTDYTQRQNAVVATQIAKEYLESALKVERVSGNLLIDRCNQYSSDGSYCISFYSK